MSIPLRPKFEKGALVAFVPPTMRPRLIAFQFNPATMQRTLAARQPPEGAAPEEANRLYGAPVETIKLEIELDALGEDLDTGPDIAREKGVHPQLAVLESLLYPAIEIVLANDILLATGTIEIVPAQGPFVVLVWGKLRRVLPVAVTGLSITEDSFDSQLNPSTAKVSLDLKVLSYSDLTLTHPGHGLFVVHQILKEGLATEASAASAKGVAASALGAVQI